MEKKFILGIDISNDKLNIAIINLLTGVIEEYEIENNRKAIIFFFAFKVAIKSIPKKPIKPAREKVTIKAQTIVIAITNEKTFNVFFLSAKNSSFETGLKTAPTTGFPLCARQTQQQNHGFFLEKFGRDT